VIETPDDAKKAGDPGVAPTFSARTHADHAHLQSTRSDLDRKNETPADFAAQVVADPEHDPLTNYDAEDVAVVATARGVAVIDPAVLSQPSHRAMVALINRSASAYELVEHAAALLSVPSIADAFPTARALELWWDHASNVAAGYPMGKLSETLHSLARWRELRAFGIEVARAAEAQDADAIIAAMKGVARLLRAMGALAETRAEA
jgi:hypothetical protein